MWRSPRPPAGNHPGPASRRDRIARLLAALTIVCLTGTFVVSDGTTFLMPGPLTSAHRAIKNCSSCHSKSGSNKLSWIRGLVSSEPLADSKACLSCHKMPVTAFFPHGASPDILIASTKRMAGIAAKMPTPPLAAQVQNYAFPTRGVVARGLYCATCHQEHQGAGFKLGKISNEQCRACHVVKFDSFDGGHPQFARYPFQRRTRIIYDHAAHFDKHFPDTAKKDAAKAIPSTCSACHDSSGDKKVMAVAPFEKTCSACHLDQITGTARVSGPKGVAFLTLPGLDLETLRGKSVPVGEWPDASEAALTPFMKMIIGRTDRGRSLLKIVEGLNLLDLKGASTNQIAAVNGLVWEIKRLFFALISGKASDILGDLNFGNGAKPTASLVADLTANIPRDVIIGAQQEWLPDLATEIANGPAIGAPQRRDLKSASTNSQPIVSESAQEQAAPKSHPETPVPAAKRKASAKPSADPPACLVRVLGQCLVSKGSDNEPEAAKPGDAAGQADESANGGKRDSSAADLAPAMRAGLGDVGPVAEARTPSQKEAQQSDDLLFPTAEELGEMKAHRKNAGREDGTEPPAGSSTIGGGEASAPQASGSSPISITSDVDPESWAEYGGWYRQDYAIFYRPAGHKDRFIYSWLFLTGPQAPKGDTKPAAAVFDALTSKDAQGACTKCHSVDNIPGRGRLVNFSPLSTANKLGRFTNFIHEPHFGVVGSRGCLTCHALEKAGSYLKSYEQGNPQSFSPNFRPVKKDVCQSCHAANAVRQDCLTCHTYHVNGVITPIIKTRNTIQ